MKAMKPIIKWVGGKTQIIDKILYNFPEEINNYYEPFVGGGSVLLGALQTGKITGRAFASDANPHLIGMYNNIKNQPNELFEEIQVMISQYNAASSNKNLLDRSANSIEVALLSKENYYYWIRKQYNALLTEEKTSVRGSAMFIFLNKTCFRGVYRVGPHGFNVPFGNYKTPEIINREHLFQMSALLQPVTFICDDFINVINGITFEDNDFIYLDPPYVPEKATSFVDYTSAGFSKDMHDELFTMIDFITNEDYVKLMMSNSAVPSVIERFTEPTYNTIIVPCKRAINSKNPDAKTNEVIVKNYLTLNC